MVTARVNSVQAQEATDFEEITVFLYIKQIGGTDIPAFVKGRDLYLPVTNIFTFLKIQNLPTPSFDTISGFFTNQQSVFLVDRVNNQINYQNKVIKLNEGDLIRTENNLYLKMTYFGSIFGLDCDYSFSNLTVIITTKLELPMIREIRQAMMRANLKKLKGEIRPDTIIKRNYPFFHFGAADWSISATEALNKQSNLKLGLALGALIAGGEASANLNYTIGQPFNLVQQNLSWHFANNDLKPFKQITLGNIPIQSIASVNAPVVGVQISNTPTTFQRSFCSYTLSDYTEPGWIVELYVNYVLVDYVKADASGYFSFEVPLVYGNSLVKLRFYGPWGEEHTREQTIRIPFNFLPPRRFEYTLSAGILENNQNTKVSKLNVNYGVNRRLTIGGGMEYFATSRAGKLMPYAQFSARLASSLLLSGEYDFGVRLKGVLSYRMKGGVLFEVYYTNYNRNQQVINTNILEERKIVVSAPIRTRNFSSLLRLTANQTIVAGLNYITSEFLISGGFFGVSANLTTNAMFLDPAHPYIYSNLSVGFKLPGKILLTPQVQYVFSQSRFLSMRIEAEKQFFRNGTVNLVYERNFLHNGNMVQLGLRYDFSAVQINTSVRQFDDVTSFIQFARGSFVYEGKDGGVSLTRVSAVGKGGVIVLPFLDMNGNNKFDPGEQKVKGLNLRISGGRVEKNTGDSTIHISDLEPFTTYYIELDRTSFENVSWQIAKPLIGVAINPNQFRVVNVPIHVMGEVSGMVMLENDTIKKGYSRMLISIYREDSTLVTKMTTEEDGFFTFYGLAPGKYFARLDASQLKNLNLTVAPDTAPFEIKMTTEGDQAEGLEFTLRPVEGILNNDH